MLYVTPPVLFNRSMHKLGFIAISVPPSFFYGLFSNSNVNFPIRKTVHINLVVVIHRSPTPPPSLSGSC